MSVMVCILCILYCGLDVTSSITSVVLFMKRFLLSCCSLTSSSEIINGNPFKTLADYFLKHLRNLVCFGRNLTAQLTFIFKESSPSLCF